MQIDGEVAKPVRRKRRHRCERCGELGALRVLYGLALAPAGDEQVIIGGCEVTGNDPGWLCRPCAGELGL